MPWTVRPGTRDAGPSNRERRARFAQVMHPVSMKEQVMNPTPMTRVARGIGLVGGAVSAAAVFALAPAAHADVPPSERIYSRTQTWTCDGLGVFEALYSPAGNNPHVKWLSPDGGRDGGVQVTIIS